MKRFNYTMNHKADEAYMAEMCRAGWAAVSLVEGVWTFEPCRPGQYTYRVCYLRGKSREEIEKLKCGLASRGIEFVSRYSFWAIFRSERNFRLYAPGEELKLCKAIRRPMLAGSVISWLAFIAFLLLTVRISVYFCFLCVPLFVYAVICTLLGASYTRLIQRLKREQI